MGSPIKDYDVIVVGGGVNGLAAAAYLQKAGQKVAVFERRDESGTFCATEEVLYPGVKLNLHASLIIAHYGTAMLDLELEKFGLELCKPPGSEYGFFYPFLDGDAVMFSSVDANLTYEMFKRISPKDAETYKKIMNFLAPFMPMLWHSELCSKKTDQSFLEFVAGFNNVPVLPKDWIYMTGFELADCLFESDKIKLALLSVDAFAGIKITDRMAGSMGFLGAMAMFTASSPMTTRGGSHDLVHSLVRCFVHHGGKIYYNCPVEKVLIENGEAKGVVLTNHACYPDAEFKASKAVISDLSAKPTFLKLVGKEHLDPAAQAAVDRFDYRGGTLFTNYYVLNERPNWAASEKFPEVNNTYSFNFGCETMDEALRRYTLAEHRGLPPDPPLVWGACANYCIADPTQAPPGQYTLMTWSMVPYELPSLGGPQAWDSMRESYADKVEDLLVQYLPNLRNSKLARYVNTPHDYVRRNPHSHGNMHPSGAISESQFWSWKPFSGCGAPKTPIDRLYISQSLGVWNYTQLGAGYIAACEVIDDLGVPRPDWWKSRALDGVKEIWAREGRTQSFIVK